MSLCRNIIHNENGRTRKWGGVCWRIYDGLSLRDFAVNVKEFNPNCILDCTKQMTQDSTRQGDVLITEQMIKAGDQALFDCQSDHYCSLNRELLLTEVYRAMRRQELCLAEIQESEKSNS